MNETLLYKIYLSFYSLKRPHNFLLVWEIDGETYTQREDFLLSHTFFREPGGANACTPLASRMVREASDRLRVPCSTLILCTLSKSDRVVLITWFPSGYTPVGPDCSDARSSPYLLITTWQLVKAHRVTRNKPKIHVICYITFLSNTNNFKTLTHQWTHLWNSNRYSFLIKIDLGIMATLWWIHTNHKRSLVSYVVHNANIYKLIQLNITLGVQTVSTVSRH